VDINSNFNEQKEETKYFWFKNPLLILFNSHHDNFSDYYNEYIRVIMDTLPLEAMSILSLNVSLDI
jgi:hypothetical protein